MRSLLWLQKTAIVRLRFVSKGEHMADHIQQFEGLATKLEHMELPAAAPAATVDICAIWKTIKPFVDTGIKLLRLLPFGWAKKLADALQLLETTLNTLCP
jgi:hypothetical protein